MPVASASQKCPPRLASWLRLAALTAVTVVGGGCATARPVPLPLPAHPPLALGVDAHLHLTMQSQGAPLFQGEPGSGVLTWDPSVRFVNTIEEGALRQAGIRFVFGTVWPPPPRAMRTALDEAVVQLARLRDFSARQPGFVVVSSAREARAAIARGAIAVLPAVEGGEGITQVDDVDRLYRAGMRSLTLVHFSDNGLAAAAPGQVSNGLFGAAAVDEGAPGLTPLGRAVVERCFELGVAVDLAHASDQSVRDTVALARAHGVPVMLSHVAARALTPIARNPPDESLRGVFGTGGVVGVTAFRAQLQRKDDGVPAGEVAGTCDDVVAHWRHVAALGGAENVVFGSDLNSPISRARPGGACPDGLRNTWDLPALWAALEARGVPRTALDGMGERLLTFVEKVEALRQRGPRGSRAEVGPRRRVLDAP